MFTRYDKAAAAAIGSALTTVIAAFWPELGVEVTASAGVLITAILTFLVPNKEV